MIRFLPLGGADEIGANCFYLNIFGTGLLLDCGTHPRKKGKESLPRFDLIKNEPLDFAIISHAHQDHIGALPFLVQEFPHVIIYSTYQTKEIAELTLHNAANILAAETLPDGDLRNYSHQEIDLLVRSMHDIEYNSPFEICGLRHSLNEKIKITLADAGHILGAASIIIEIAGQKIIYTGDINLSNQMIMQSADISLFENATILLTETTYGSTDSLKLGSWTSEAKRFAKHANKVLHNGGSVLIPVFALGKTQEILALIYNLMERKILTESFFYTGGIGREISNIYDRNRYLVNRGNKELVLKDIPQTNVNDVEDLNLFKKNPGIVLASSGMMLKGTTSYRLMEYWIKQSTFGIFSVGYMDSDTPGYKIMNSKKGESLILSEGMEPQKILCDVDRFYFPSHSKREDLLAIAKSSGASKIILLHGESESQNWIGQHLLNTKKSLQLYSAELGKQINLL
jgi:Cft2 family RNA processing exonuclease